MNTKEQTYMNIPIYIDGELQVPSEPTTVERLGSIVEHIQTSIAQFTGTIALQARMATFDAVHGTNYREIRNTLVEQQKRHDFEKRIGLIAVKR